MPTPPADAAPVTTMALAATTGEIRISSDGRLMFVRTVGNKFVEYPILAEGADFVGVGPAARERPRP